MTDPVKDAIRDLRTISERGEIDWRDAARLAGIASLIEHIQADREQYRARIMQLERAA